MKNIWVDMAYLLIGVLILLAPASLKQALQREQRDVAFNHLAKASQQALDLQDTVRADAVIEKPMPGESVFIVLSRGGAAEARSDGSVYTIKLGKLRERVLEMKTPRTVVLSVREDVTYSEYVPLRNALQQLRSEKVVQSLLEANFQTTGAP